LDAYNASLPQALKDQYPPLAWDEIVQRYPYRLVGLIATRVTPDVTPPDILEARVIVNTELDRDAYYGQYDSLRQEYPGLKLHAVLIDPTPERRPEHNSSGPPYALSPIR
jgi:hypothetical protein